MSKMSTKEYEELGKINTKKALEELQKTIENRVIEEELDTESDSDYEFDSNTDKQFCMSAPKFQNNSDSDDRAMCMFNNLIDRNQMLQDKLYKSENSFENLKRKMRELEKKEYTQMVQYTSLESINDDLSEELKKKHEIINVKNKLIISNVRIGYINRFIIIGLVLLMTYIYLINNLDKMDNLFRVIN